MYISNQIGYTIFVNINRSLAYKNTRQGLVGHGVAGY